MSVDSVQIFSPIELEEKLEELSRLLTCLPGNILDGHNHYNFQHFSPDPTEVIDIGLDSAVNHALELILVPEGRRNGITFKEKGPGLTAIIDVLCKFNTKFEGHAVLQKWVLDLIDAAIKAGEVISCDEYIPIDPVLLDSTNTVTKRKQDITNKPEVTNKKIKFDSVPKKKGGRPADPLLSKLRIPCQGPGKKFRCAGRGCRTEWENASAYRERVFKHAQRCHFIPVDLKRQVGDSLHKRSLGHFFEKEHEDQKQEQDSEIDKSTSSESQKNGSCLKDLAEQGSRVQLIKKVNFAVLKLICTCGIPPSLVDRLEWKELLKVANPKYEAPSSKTFTDSLIPAEHAFVKLKQLEHLQTCENLTVSFDGGTTAGLQSIYSVHVITPECRAFLVEGSEASTESHTAQHLFGILDTVIKAIGPQRFRGITSDNTGNTSAARRLIQDAYPWIIILPDPCHRLNLLCKDIGNFDAFKDIISQIQCIVQYFHKSTNSTSTLKLKRHELGIVQGIKSVGNTQFGTVYYAALSIEQNYAALVELFKGGEIKAPEIAPFFLPGFTSSAFSFGLQHLVMVLSPMAKAITCLESSHSTVADVYLFWLAVTADVHYMLSQGSLTTSDSEKICCAVNRCFNQMVNEAPSDVYITGFVLDPRFRNVHIMRDLNPLEIPKVSINLRDTSGRPAQSKANEKLPATLVRIGNFLFCMLRKHYRSINKDIAGLKQADARLRLPRQILEYQKSEYPFDMRFKKNSSAGDWWARLDKNPDTQPLAKLARSLFEILPNSMSDERTASTFTWLNSPLRNKQDASTLVRMATIREWYRFDPKNRPNLVRPTVKFCDMTEVLFQNKTPPAKSLIVLEGQTTPDDPDDVIFDAQGVNFDNFVEGDVSTDNEDANDHISNYSGDRFDLESQINLAAPILHDVLSEDGIDPRILEATTNVNEIDKYCSGEDSDDLKDDDLWKMD